MSSSEREPLKVKQFYFDEQGNIVGARLGSSASDPNTVEAIIQDVMPSYKIIHTKRRLRKIPGIGPYLDDKQIEWRAKRYARQVMKSRKEMGDA